MVNTNTAVMLRDGPDFLNVQFMYAQCTSYIMSALAIIMYNSIEQEDAGISNGWMDGIFLINDDDQNVRCFH